MLGTRSTALHRGNSAFWLRLTSMTGRIHLKNMAFYGYHGHHPEEGTRGQRFLVDLYLTYDMQEAANISLEEVDVSGQAFRNVM